LFDRQAFRARLLTGGELRVAEPRPHARLGPGPVAGAAWRVADVREPSFLTNPRTTQELRVRTGSVALAGRWWSAPETLPWLGQGWVGGEYAH
jgi:hypothetical protein